VTKVFPGAENFVAVKNMSFQLQPGSMTALYGPSGSGKSTILNLASGMDRATQGRITIGSFDLTAMTAAQLTVFRRDYLGFIFQSYNLFPTLTAVENVEMIDLLKGKPQEEARAAALSALEQVGLSTKSHQFPGQLSGGQQQRVAVARALCSRPQILFADEPTANLDSKTGLELIELLTELNQKEGMTILFSTHDPQLLNRIPTKISLKDGALVRVSTSENFQSNP
jgi:putative ABC transport system ATP-binding protein